MTDAIFRPMRNAKRPRDASPPWTAMTENGKTAPPPTRLSRIPLLKRPLYRPANTKKIVVFNDPKPESDLPTDITNDTRPTKRRKTIEGPREPLAQKTNSRHRLTDIDLTPIQHSKKNSGASNTNNNIFLRNSPTLPSLPTFALLTGQKRTLLATEHNMNMTSPELPKFSGSKRLDPLLNNFASPKVERKIATLRTPGLGPPAKIDDRTALYKLGSNNRRPSASCVLQSADHQVHRRSSGSHVLNTSKRSCSWLEVPDTLAIRARRRGSLRNALGNPVAESTPQQTCQCLGTPMSISRLGCDDLPPILSKPLSALSTPSWAATPHARDAVDDLSDGISLIRVHTDITPQVATIKPALRLPGPDQRRPQTPLPPTHPIGHDTTRSSVLSRSVSYSPLALTEQRSLIPSSSNTPAPVQTPTLLQSPVRSHGQPYLNMSSARVPSPPLSPLSSDDPLDLFLISDDTDRLNPVNLSQRASRSSPVASSHTIGQTGSVRRPGRWGRTYRARKTQKSLPGSRKGIYRSTRPTRHPSNHPMAPFSSDDPLLLVGKVRNG